MGLYSIKDIEALSGIKAHTLRIWEQRYNIIQPKRTASNIRYYDDDDLKYVLNISLLTEYGYKISRIASMSKDELCEKVMELSGKEPDKAPRIQALVYTMLEMDEPGFERILSTSILQKGLEKSILEIIYPLLRKTGVLWQTGAINPAHEHFISNLVRQKLIVAIDGQVPAPSGTKPTFLLYLPEGELHEIGLLFAWFILRSRGFPVIYLGQNVPLEDMTEAARIQYPDYLLTVFAASYPEEQLLEHLQNVEAAFPDRRVLTGGSPVACVSNRLPSNTIFLKDIPALTQFLASL